MNPDRVECPRCARPMHRGFILDSGHQGSNHVSRWVEGAPEKSWLGLKLKGRTKLPMTVFRCERCGLLESYALAEG